MKKLYTILLISLIAVKANAQFTIAQKTITDVGITNNTTSAILQQPDGKIISLGSVQEGSKYKIALLRFDSTGKPDAGFGNMGIDTFSIARILPLSYGGASLKALALQTDGKIVVAGTAYESATFYGDLLVMRFNKNGTIDSSFGKKGSTDRKSVV